MTGAHGAMIREAALADLDVALDLYPLLFEPPGAPPPEWDPEAARERLRGVIEGERSVILVAEVGDELVGLCTAYLDVDSVRYGQRCWVEDLIVSSARRSQGIGEALLSTAREWAAEHGATHLELDSGRARKDAHRFYERQSPDWSGIQYSWLV